MVDCPLRPLQEIIQISRIQSRAASLEQSFNFAAREVVGLVSPQPGPVLLQLLRGPLQLVLLDLVLVLQGGVDFLQVRVSSPELLRLPRFLLHLQKRLSQRLCLFHLLKTFPKSKHKNCFSLFKDDLSSSLFSVSASLSLLKWIFLISSILSSNSLDTFSL